MNPAPFFKFARDRHAIYLARQDGQPAPWTDDPVLHKYRFTNVYRELDATTIWFRENVRDKVDVENVLLATVLFRWFNRIKTGDALFKQIGDWAGLAGSVDTAFNEMVNETKRGFFSRSMYQDVIMKFCGDGPYVTGAYIIKTPDGYTKLDGVLQCIEWFVDQQYPCRMTDLRAQVEYDIVCQQHKMTTKMIQYSGGVTLENVWLWLKKFPYLGDFMAYEIVTDLRHTPLLNKAPDIMTWANPGPGAMRGMNRLMGRDKNYRQPKHVFICEMRELLELSKVRGYWPNNDTHPPLEMRDIEHTLCEFDKYERARLGDGRPRGTYPHA